MNLLTITKRECIATGVSASDKTDCLHKVAQLAKQSPCLKAVSDTDIFEALQKREALGSTGFENGIAIPHCRMDNVDAFVVGVMTVPGGIDFDSLDGEKSDLIVFIIAPQNKTNEHIRLLSSISNILRIPEARQAMLAADSSESLLERFLRFNADKAENGHIGQQSLFHITLANENLFESVLQVVTAMEPTSLSIIDAKPATEYLAKMPLFAGFWNERETVTTKLIVCQIDKRLTNETIRRIEDVTGKLDNSTEVAVCVQEIFYSAGRIQS